MTEGTRIPRQGSCRARVVQRSFKEVALREGVWLEALCHSLSPPVSGDWSRCLPRAASVELYFWKSRTKEPVPLWEPIRDQGP